MSATLATLATPLILDLLARAPQLTANVIDYIIQNPADSPADTLAKIADLKVQQSAEDAEFERDLPKPPDEA